jgi:murein DD-endopeptidase MepM/ murein hydrolase activator NlpD
MAKLNLIDPNNVILGLNNPFKDLGNGIPAFEDIRSYVQLTMHPKNSNYIEIQNGRIVGNSSVGSGEEIVLTGYHSVSASKKDKEYNYYSTNYTEDNYKNKNGESEFEGFGIKDVDITFDANKIPQVAITFYDVRGNVLNDFNSRFAKMFQLPYPIFELKIKGGFGPVITYRLQKIRDDISIDSSGNYTISSKFIGDRFAPLSDVPLNYLQAVPYLDNQPVDVADSIVKSFHELMINAKRLYEKLNQEINSDNEVLNQSDLTKSTDNLASLTTIIELLNKKPEFISGITNDERFTADFDTTEQSRITNYLDLTTFQDNKINLKQYTPVEPPLKPTFELEKNEYNFISDVIRKQINLKNDVIKGLGYGTALIDFSSTSYNIAQFNNTIIPVSIDYTKLYNKINDITGEITTKAISNAATLTTKLSRLVNDNLGGKRLTIGDIFSLIFQDYNKLMNKIFEAGNKGFGDDIRLKNKQTYDKIGFPTVVEKDNDGANRLIYPGKNPLFKDWPEVKLIEDFINAFVKAQINNLLTDLVLSRSEDGSSKYIPINGREVYKLTDTIPASSDKITNPINVYVSKTPPQICQLIYERFLILTNINLKVTTTDYADWKNGSNDNDFFKKWVVGLFDKGVEDVETQKNLFLSAIAAEARNIAFALMIADETTKDYFTNLATEFTGFEYFAANKNQSLSTSKIIVDNQVVNTNQIPITELMGIGVGFSKDKNYVTIYTALPNQPVSFVNDGTANTPPDIITTYMLGLHELNEKYKVTKDNIIYIDDAELEKTGVASDGLLKSDYTKDNPGYYDISRLNYSLYRNDIDIRGDIVFCEFNLKLLYDNARFPALLEIPKGILVIISGLLLVYEKYYPDERYWDLPISTKGIGDRPIFRIIKNSNFYNYLKYVWREANDNTKGFSYNVYTTPNYTIKDAAGAFVSTVVNAVEDFFVFVAGAVGAIDKPVAPTVAVGQTYTFDGFKEVKIALNAQPTTDEQKKEINAYLYTKCLLSVNSREFTSILSPDDKFSSDGGLYAQYLKQLLPKLAQLVKEDKKTLEDKLKSYKSQMQDNDVKLSMYKSFQVIYENYLYGSSPKEFEFDIKTNFKFVDRAYNDISTIGVLDIKTLLSDTQDTNVSLLTAISRLLSDNNYWFYPFQGFLTTADDYGNLFKIDYEQTVTTKPMFVAMYVGGLSSNPIAPPNATTLANDGIVEGEPLPLDFGKTTGGFNAFKVKYTGTQNQMVFSDFQHSTESLKNTDEGLRIQSEIIGNASNSFAIPKGQSLLTVYQKQSYTSTVKIPFGNMGIQPTQYFYLEFIPIFEGLYIIYNVSHNINSDTQRLETTFKGYRVKKDVNPIILSELVDFTRDNFYTQTLDKIGFPSNKTNLTPQEIQAIEEAITREDTVSGWKVTSTFLRSDNKTIHGAIDIGTDVGTNITFTYPDVTFVSTNFDAGGYGYYIVLRSKKDKVDFIFAHLQEYSAELKKLKENDAVPIDMIIGKTGQSGGPRTINASFFGPHLHFEVREMPWPTSKRLSYIPYTKNLILKK